MHLRFGLGALLFATLGACGPSPEEQEAARLLVVIERLRSAPADGAQDRMPLVDALATTPATTPGAIAARDRCVDAYRALEEANAAERRARKALAAAESGGALGAAVLTDVALAETRLADSRTAMPACEEAQAALGRGKGK